MNSAVNYGPLSDSINLGSLYYDQTSRRNTLAVFLVVIDLIGITRFLFMKRSVTVMKFSY
jgi:hypothetical protein